MWEMHKVVIRPTQDGHPGDENQIQNDTRWTRCPCFGDEHLKIMPC